MPLSPAGGSRRARPSSSSSRPQTPRAAYRRASSGCTPACSSAQAARGGTSRGMIFTARTASRPARRREKARSQAAPAAAVLRQVRACRSPHRVTVTAWPFAASCCSRAHSRSSSCCQAEAQAGQSCRSAASRRSCVMRSSGGGAGAWPAGRAPLPLTQNELTGSWPPRLRSSLTGCVYSSICISCCSRRSGWPALAARHPVVDHATHHAVERGTGELREQRAAGEPARWARRRPV